MNNKGTAILDSVISIAIFAVLFTGFYALLQTGIKTVTEHKARAGALAIARSHIEYIHSLDYAVIGVQGGNPSGNIPSSETQTINGIEYTQDTTITWHDDAGDGLSGAGDSNPNDYKDVRVEVSWPEHAGQSGTVVLSTFVADFETE